MGKPQINIKRDQFTKPKNNKPRELFDLPMPNSKTQTNIHSEQFYQAKH